MTEQLAPPTESAPASPGPSPIDPPAPLSAVEVAVNLLWCVPGDVGGSEHYLVRQLLGLAEQRAEFVPTLYCLPSFAKAHPELGDLFRLETASITGTERPRRILAEHTWLARRTRDVGLVHHGGGTVPRFGGSPRVLTLHDLQYLTFPHYLGAAKLRYLRSAVPASARRAAVICVPTAYVRDTVVERFGVEADRVVVVPHGIEPTIGDGAPTDFELRRDYGLGSGRVVVYPAITHPHKGHRFLLDVLAEHWTDPDLRLVLLGGAGAADREVVAEIARRGLTQRVIRTGRVPDAHRDGLLRLADALVFPSEYEGFGAPVIEAMALGTPVVCSDQAALREVAGDAGHVIPLDRDAWAGALDHVDREREAMISAGRRRARAFTAARSGEALAEAYRRALRRR